jgi:hypothetical protein
VSTRAALVTGGLCALAVIVSHQLSPVMLILSLGALAVMIGRPPVWALAVLVAIEAWWLYLSYDFVSAHFRIFSLDLAATARPAAPSLPGAELGVNASRAAMVALVLLAACGVVRRLRAGHLDLGALTLAAAPALAMGIQVYGGEAPLRAYLFALPWLAFFVAAACDATPVHAAWRVFCVTVVLGAGTLFGYFGQEMVNLMGHDDVAASRWWLDNSPPGASLTLVAPNFPSRLNARYAEHLDSPPSLVETPGFRPHRLGTRDVPALEALLRRNGAPARYVALSPSGARYARFYGLAPAGSFERLARALEKAPCFQLVYRRGAASIFEYVPTRLDGSRGPIAARRRRSASEPTASGKSSHMTRPMTMIALAVRVDDDPVARVRRLEAARSPTSRSSRRRCPRRFRPRSRRGRTRPPVPPPDEP